MLFCLLCTEHCSEFVNKFSEQVLDTVQAFAGLSLFGIFIERRKENGKERYYKKLAHVVIEAYKS